ncbi:MAG: pyridoxal phosphate-dependent aminotransferase [Patescibacteria group bacterium]
MPLSKRVKNLKNNPVDSAFKFAEKFPQAISLAGGTPQFGLPQTSLQTICEALKSNPNIVRYSAYAQGDPELRNLIAEDLSLEFARKVVPEEILITAGSTSSLFSAIQAFTDPGDEIALFSPHWSLYQDQCALCGDKILEIPLSEENGWDFDKSKLLEKVSDKTRALIIADPNNPTGTIFSTASKKMLIKVSHEKNINLIVDETYRHIIDSGSDYQSLGKLSEDIDAMMIIRSFSKDFSMSGLRLGYIYSSKENIAKLSRIHTSINLFPSTLSEELGKLLYRDKEKIVSNYSNRYTKLRQLVCSRLDKLPKLFQYVKPQGGFFVFPKYSLTMNSVDFFKLLLEAGIVVRPGIGFGLGGEKHIRISFVSNEELINKAFDRIEKYFNHYGKGLK